MPGDARPEFEREVEEDGYDTRRAYSSRNMPQARLFTMDGKKRSARGESGESVEKRLGGKLKKILLY